MHKISAKTDHWDDLHRSPLQITSSAPLSSCAASAAVAFSVSKVSMALRRASAWSERGKNRGKSMDAIDSTWIYHGGKKRIEKIQRNDIRIHSYQIPNMGGKKLRETMENWY